MRAIPAPGFLTGCAAPAAWDRERAVAAERADDTGMPSGGSSFVAPSAALEAIGDVSLEADGVAASWAFVARHLTATATRPTTPTRTRRPIATFLEASWRVDGASTIATSRRPAAGGDTARPRSLALAAESA